VWADPYAIEEQWWQSGVSYIGVGVGHKKLEFMCQVRDKSHHSYPHVVSPV
jgi:hypothetical protein